MGGKIRSRKSREDAQKAFEQWIVQYKPTRSGDSSLPYKIDTQFGEMLIGFDVASSRTYPLNPDTPCHDWLFCRFENPSRAKNNVTGMNPFTGKWNHPIPLENTAMHLHIISLKMFADGTIQH